MNNKIFITGGTGYIGNRLIPELIKNNFEVIALVRKGSESKLPEGCNVVFGNALDNSTYENYVSGCDTFIHLIGVAHPGPGKKQQFNSIDLVSIQQAVPAANNAGIKHFIYLSVAHPAPVMKEFIEMRIKGEELIRESGMNASFIRPWYVLGPGHYWPYLLIPFYKLFEFIPAAKTTALRLGLVKIDQIINCITYAVQNPPEGIYIYDVEKIKSFNF
ncbi:MAG TPA: NAD(P)H-binding protein [Ignavibacteria bacterium]|nr:NAD(P)H-binding protein [Ignavibacteria bacterium]